MGALVDLNEALFEIKEKATHHTNWTSRALHPKHTLKGCHVRSASSPPAVITNWPHGDWTIEMARSGAWPGNDTLKMAEKQSIGAQAPLLSRV